MVTTVYLKSVGFNRKFLIAFFMVSLSGMNYASLSKTSQVMTRSLCQSVCKPNLLQRHFPLAPQASKIMITSEGSLIQSVSIQPQVKLLGSGQSVKLLGNQNLASSGMLSQEEEQNINNLIASYAQRRLKNSIERNKEACIHFARMEIVNARREDFENEMHQHMMREFDTFKTRREMARIEFFGFLLTSLSFTAVLVSMNCN